MSIEGLNMLYGDASISNDELSADTSAKNTLGKDDFLTLLIAQIKNQDPLNPLKGAEFTAQLAQFNSLEQLFGMNDSLSSIQESLEIQENSNILDYIGKVIKTEENTISISNGKIDSCVYTLEDMANVSIVIYNDEGHNIQKIDMGLQDSGQHDLLWDGTDYTGEVVEDGIYAFDIEATDNNGYVVPTSSYFTGIVTGIGYQDGIPLVMVGNKAVSPDSIIEVVENNNL